MIPVAFEKSIDSSDKNIASNIKLPVVYSKLIYWYKKQFYKYF